jgi:uncharacterized protein YktA (UPF0223 family)
MENLNVIQWLDVSTRGKNNMLNDLEISVNLYRKVNKNQSGYIAFSKHLSDKYKNFKKIRIGKLQGKIIFQFNDDDGHSFSKTDNMLSRLSSKLGAQTIFENYQITKDSTVRFEIAELGNNMLLITKISN